MDDNTKFPPAVDLSQRTELRWSNLQQPIVVAGGPTNAGKAYVEPAPPAHLSPYPTKET